MNDENDSRVSLVQNVNFEENVNNDEDVLIYNRDDNSVVSFFENDENYLQLDPSIYTVVANTVGTDNFATISNKFGIPREQVVKSLKSRHYKLGSLPHINLTDYGNQPE